MAPRAARWKAWAALATLAIHLGLRFWFFQVYYGVGLKGLGLHVLAAACCVAAAVLVATARRRSVRLRIVALAIGFLVLEAACLATDGIAVFSRASWGTPVDFRIVADYLEHPFALAALYPRSAASIVVAVAASVGWLVLILPDTARTLIATMALLSEKRPRMVGRLRMAAVTCVLVTIVSFAAIPDIWRRNEPYLRLLNDDLYETLAPLSIFSAPRPDYRVRYQVEALALGPLVRPRPIVLILVDALRDDVVDARIAGEPTTPFLSALIRGPHATRYARTYSGCTMSFCGILGALASRYRDQLTVPPDNIADVLHPFGYRTHFFLSGNHARFFSLRRVIGPAVSDFRDGAIEPSLGMNDDRNVLAWMDTTRRDRRPDFYYIHLMSAHELGTLFPPFSSMRRPIADATTVRYLAGVRQADFVIQRIFAKLRVSGLLSDALEIVSADHGEHLGEHGLHGHGKVPLEPVARIPLLVYDETRGRYPPRDLAAQVDIAPTFLSAVGIPVPGDWAGFPLQMPCDRRVIPVQSFESIGIVVRGASWQIKYLRNRATGSEQVFDLVRDPRETTNLADANHAGQVRALRRLADRNPGERCSGARE